MADSDEDFSVSSSSDTAVPQVVEPNSDGNREERAILRRSLRESAPIHPRTEAPQRVSLPQDLSSVNEHIDRLTNMLNGQDIDLGTSLRVLVFSLELQKSYLLACRKAGTAKRSKIAKPQVRAEVCQKMHLSRSTYGKIHRSYYLDHKIYVSGQEGQGRTGNGLAKQTRIPTAHKVQIEVRDFVRQQWMKKVSVTCKKVLDFLIEKEYLHVPTDEFGRYVKKDLASALRCVHRWMKEYNGYFIGQRKGNLLPNNLNLAKRNYYVRKLFTNQSLPPGERKREVYVGESYIQEHYKRSGRSIWDPNDEQDLVTSKAQNKGKRLCFAAAIQGPNPNPMATDPPLDQDNAGIVPGSVWKFCPQKAWHHQGDFRRAFKAVDYIYWWRDQLLPSLMEPSIIVVDNAKYHNAFGKHVPDLREMKKKECQEYMTSKGIPFAQAMSSVELRQKIRAYIAANEKPEIVRLAELAGHEVLFIPPYYSDLQPIQLVWGHIKGCVGQKYDSGTTLAIVDERLKAEFATLEGKHDIIDGMIQKTTAHAKELYDEMDADNFSDSDSDNGDETNDEESSFDGQDGHQYGAGSHQQKDELGLDMGSDDEIED